MIIFRCYGVQGVAVGRVLLDVLVGAPDFLKKGAFAAKGNFHGVPVLVDAYDLAAHFPQGAADKAEPRAHAHGHGNFDHAVERFEPAHKIQVRAAQGIFFVFIAKHAQHIGYAAYFVPFGFGCGTKKHIFEAADAEYAFTFIKKNRRLFTREEAVAELTERFNNQKLKLFGMNVWEAKDTAEILSQLFSEQRIRICSSFWKGRLDISMKKRKKTILSLISHRHLHHLHRLRQLLERGQERLWQLIS